MQTTSKTFHDILKFNPNHDNLGRFSSGSGGSAASLHQNGYNSATMTSQYKDTPAMNEYDYFSKDQEKFRIQSIKELSGADDEKASEYLKALCGTSDEYTGIGNNVPKGWFSGSDSDIRSATSREYREKAETIHDYITRSPKYEGEIYRGLTMSESQIQSIKTGGTFEENGLLSSWTSSKDVASMFADGRSEEMGTKPVIITTKNPKYGTPVSHLSIFGSEEQEVLVSNMTNSKYKIGTVKENNGTVYVELLGGD